MRISNKITKLWLMLFLLVVAQHGISKQSVVGEKSCKKPTEFKLVEFSINSSSIRFYESDSANSLIYKYGLDDNYTDKTVLINLWAIWCKPCRQELPILDNLSKFSIKNLENIPSDRKYSVILINLGDNISDIKKLFYDLDIKNIKSYQHDSYGIIHDLNLNGLPASIVIQKVNSDKSKIFISQGMLKSSAVDLDNWLTCLNKNN